MDFPFFLEYFLLNEIKTKKRQNVVKNLNISAHKCLLKINRQNY